MQIYRRKTLIVTFVCSANTSISPIVQAQGQSLQKVGVDLSYYGVKGKGLFGYLFNLPRLRRTIQKANSQVIHAHYSFCGIVSALATGKPVITSLMGSDVKSSGFWRVVIRFFVKHIWKATIVKSEDMKRSLGVYSDKVLVIPNGVDLDVFRPLTKSECRIKVGWEERKSIVLFAANPDRHEKNFELAKKSFLKADLQNSELKVVYNVKHEDIPLYLCASDVLISTSKWEGSPNIIKEAMACNTPIVSTDVGDVSNLSQGLDSMWICDADPQRLSKAIIKAMNFTGYVLSRDRIVKLGLDSVSVAENIQQLYHEVLHVR